MSADSIPLPTATTRAEWRAIEQAATRELRRRADAAHALVIAMLQRHAGELSAKQLAQIRRCLGQGR